MSQIINRRKSTSEEPVCYDKEKAYSILLLGQAELSKGHLEKSLILFDEASALKSGDPKLFFEQGLSLFDFGTEEGKEKSLLLANKKFKAATTLFPEYFEAWQLWGISLSYLGKTYEEAHYFVEAEKKLLRAIAFSKKADVEQLYDLYLEYASVKASLAKRSGEAYDWQQAIDAFDKASTIKNVKDVAFWNQFGLASLKLSKLLCDVKLCVKSIHCFKCAITTESTNCEGWRNLSHSMEFLYKRTHDEDHFAQANDCFGTAAGFSPVDAPLWLEWATFLLNSGKITSDPKRLRLSIEKCAQAYSIDPELPEVLACWGESLALLGEYGEQIELIHDGQNKATEATEIDPKNPELFRALGETLNSLGRYFEEADYHYQAIEKFQAGLSLDRSQHALWFAIGSTYTLIGKLLNDTETLEQALYFLKKAIDLNASISQYHFGHAHCLSKIGELSQKEEWLEASITEFERALYIQKNAVYLHPDWLFQYGKTLDLYAEFFEEESHYLKAIEIFSHVLMIDPDFPEIHYHLALVYSHLGELKEENDSFYRALHFFKLAAKHQEENDQILVDLGVTLINIAEQTTETIERETCYQEAEGKLMQAAKSGNLQAYYQLACLFSLQGQLDKAMSFLLKAESYDALPYIEELLEDDWLASVRDLSSFRELLHYLEKKEILHEDR